MKTITKGVIKILTNGSNENDNKGGGVKKTITNGVIKTITKGEM